MNIDDNALQKALIEKVDHAGVYLHEGHGFVRLNAGLPTLETGKRCGWIN
ncbi:hypothetical protein ACLB1Q_04430 [Escherichia coli]